MNVTCFICFHISEAMEVQIDVSCTKNTILDKELSIVIRVQKKLSPWFDYPAIVIHYLFKEDILMLLSPISVFLFNYYAGMVLAITCILVEIYAGMLKWAFRSPRPLWADTNGQLVNRKGEWEQDYGFPSAHSMLATSMAMSALLIYIDIKCDPDFMAIHDINKDRFVLLIFCIIAIVLSLLTGLSRIYFAVHYLRDVIGGYILGVLLALLTYFLIKETRSINEWVSIGIGIALTCITLLLMIITRPLCPQDRVQMPIWEANALNAWNARSGQNVEKHPVGLHPRSIARYISAYAILFGLWIGDPIFRLSHNGNLYHECQEWTKTKGIRFGIGMLGVFLILIIIYVIIPKISKRKTFRYPTEAIFGVLFGLWLSLIPAVIFHATGYNECY